MRVPAPHHSCRSRQQGFTLVELLMVIAVILILASITFGISRGVQNAQARSKAKAELANIAQALEQFKSTYGDYPWVGDTSSSTANANILLKALTGWTTLEIDSTVNPPLVSMDTVPTDIGPKKTFIDTLKLSLNSQLPEAGPPSAQVYLIDPWGNQYVYAYKTSSGGSWDNFGYLLFSEGGDSASATIPADGIIDQSWRGLENNIDNIYAGE